MTALLSFVHGASPVHAVCNKTVGTRTFEQCQDLAALGATYAWSLNNDTNSVDFAFSGTNSATLRPLNLIQSFLQIALLKLCQEM